MIPASHRRLGQSTAAVLFALCAFGSPARPQTCSGDCNLDGEVTLGEVQISFNAFLGTGVLEACVSADVNGDLEVSLGEVQTAFNQFLGSCEAPFDPLEGTDAVEGGARASLGTIEAFTVLNFGMLSASGGGAADLEPSRLGLATAARVAVLPDALGGGGAGGVLELCGLSGRRTIDCVPGPEAAMRSVRFEECRESAGEGTFRIRNGLLSQTVSAPGFCDDLVIPPSAVVTLELEDYSDAIVTADEQLVRHFGATLVDSFAPSGPGCMGPDGVETIDGVLRFECSPELADDCSDRIAEVTLRPRSLVLARESAPGTGGLCALTVVADGGLGVDNARLGERFDLDYAGFEQRQRGTQDEGLLVEQRGRMRVSCIGDVQIESTPDVPLRLPSVGECPLGGDLRLALLGDGGSPSAGSAIEGPRPSISEQSRAGSGAALSVTSGLVEHAFRAAGGNVYQVLQNPEGEASLGVDDYRLTTLVGSADAVARCDSTQGSVFVPQAVVAAAPGQAFAPGRVVRSGVVPLAGTPCFNPNGARGAGVVCVGPGCSAECGCTGNCSRFTIANGIPITTDGEPPAAGLASIGPLGVPCSGFTGQETYAFGAETPTVESERCAASPGDGFTLPLGSSLIVAYEAPFARPFGTGAGGFAIDADASTECGAEGAVITGVATRNELRAPLVRFNGTQAVEIDLNDDERVDRARRGCGDLSLMRCGEPAPTPTATPIVQVACRQSGLPDKDVAVLSDSTTGQLDQLGDATCGDGGSSSAERAYGYRAPVAGFYTIDTLGGGDSFDTLLYVRRSSPNDVTCDGAELACNDNAGPGQLLSEVTVFLDAGEEVVIVVDGAAGEQGDFLLSLSRSDTAPSPTPTPTPRADLPDLVVNAVAAPPKGEIGEPIEVSATVSNKGDAVAPESQLGVVFNVDPGFVGPSVPSGARCRIASLAPGESDDCTLPVPVPDSLFAGTHFVGAIADVEDEIAEREEGNNLGADVEGIDLSGGRPTPTFTPGPTPRPCGERAGVCSGACTTPGAFCGRLGGGDCRCIRIFLPTPTPTPRPCGSTFPQCNGRCSPGSVCFERVLGCACVPILLP